MSEEIMTLPIKKVPQVINSGRGLARIIASPISKCIERGSSLLGSSLRKNEGFDLNGTRKLEDLSGTKKFEDISKMKELSRSKQNSP